MKKMISRVMGLVMCAALALSIFFGPVYSEYVSWEDLPVPTAWVKD